MKFSKRRLLPLSGVAIQRQKMGYSQAAFAQLLGIPKSTLSMAECRKRDLPLSALIKLAAIEKEYLTPSEKEEANPETIASLEI